MDKLVTMLSSRFGMPPQAAYQLARAIDRACDRINMHVYFNSDCYVDDYNAISVLVDELADE